MTVSELRGQPQLSPAERGRRTSPPSTTSGSGTPIRASRCRPSRSSRTSAPTTRSSRLASTATRSDGKLTPAIVGVRQINPSASALVRLGQHPPPVHPRRGAGAGRGQRRPRRRATRSSPSRTCRRSPTDGLPDHHPARRLLRPEQTRATWWPTPSSPSSTTRWVNGTNVETHYRATGGVRLELLPHQGGLRRPPRRLQPADLEPDHRPVADHVRPRHPGRWPRRRRRSSASTPTPTRRWSTGTSTGSSTPTPRPTSTPTRRTPTPRRSRPDCGLPAQLQLRAQLGEGGHRRLLGEDDLLRHGPATRPDPARPTRRPSPHMFTPASKMSAALKAHLRYPEDLFSIQAAMYGRYHITNASDFYTAPTAVTPGACRRPPGSARRPAPWRSPRSPTPRARSLARRRCGCRPSTRCWPSPGETDPVLHHLRRLRARRHRATRSRTSRPS